MVHSAHKQASSYAHRCVAEIPFQGDLTNNVKILIVCVLKTSEDPSGSRFLSAEVNQMRGAITAEVNEAVSQRTAQYSAFAQSLHAEAVVAQNSQKEISEQRNRILAENPSTQDAINGRLKSELETTEYYGHYSLTNSHGPEAPHTQLLRTLTEQHTSHITPSKGLQQDAWLR